VRLLKSIFLVIATAIGVGLATPVLARESATPDFAQPISKAAPIAPPIVQDEPEERPNLETLNTLSQHMENIIASQANQINVLSWILAVFAASVALLGLGLVAYAKKKIDETVKTSAFEFMKQDLNTANTYANNRNCILHTTLLNVARDLAYNAKKRLGALVEGGELDLNKRDDVDLFLDSVSNTFLTPLHIFSTISEILASRQHTPNLKEKIYILYAEVSAGNIETSSILPVLVAAREILINNDSRSPAITYLEKFETVVRDTPRSKTVPSTPPF